MQKCGCISGKDFANGCVAEHSVQSSDAGGQIVGGAAAARPLDRFDCLSNTVDGVTDGMGEIAIEEKKFEDAVGRHIGCVDLAIGFERGATTEKPDLLEVLLSGGALIGRLDQ